MIVISFANYFPNDISDPNESVPEKLSHFKFKNFIKENNTPPISKTC